VASPKRVSTSVGRKYLASTETIVFPVEASIPISSIPPPYH